MEAHFLLGECMFVHFSGRKRVFSCRYLSACLRAPARAVLRIDSATQQPLCSSEHMVCDTSLSSAILSIRHNGSQDSSPFYCDWRPVWRKTWTSISGSLFPGSSFWTPRMKMLFKKWIHYKGKKRSLCLQLTFSWFLFILAGTMRFSPGIGDRGNNGFQVTWKVKLKRRRVSFLIVLWGIGWKTLEMVLF